MPVIVYEAGNCSSLVQEVNDPGIWVASPFKGQAVGEGVVPGN